MTLGQDHGWGRDVGGPRPILVLDTFDGCHLGHQALLAAAHGVAHDRRTIVEAIVLVGAGVCGGRPIIDQPEARCEFALRAGVLRCSAIEVERFSEIGAAASLAIQRIQPVAVVVSATSFDGHAATALQASADRVGANVMNLEPFIVDEVVVSSATILAALDRRDMKGVSALTGRFPTLTGRVEIGDQRGRTIGFPTANLHVPDCQAQPPRGVYACWAMVDGERYQAAVNIGSRPTFYRGGGATIVEAHLVGFVGDLYGHRLTLTFVEHIRPEVQFSSVAELKCQLQRDVAGVSALLGAAAREIA